MSPAPSNARLAALPRAVFAPLAAGDGVIVDAEKAFYFSLNRTAAFLWDHLRAVGGASADDLTAALTARFEIDAGGARRDVDSFLTSVVEFGLAAPAQGAAAFGGGHP